MKNSRRLRILWCGEASFLKTGYAIYAKELLSRLYGTRKYEIAEMGCYASHDNPEINKIPWRFYPTLPINQDEATAYNDNQSYQFGEWRFDDVCLDFKPDVVIDIRDWWMVEYQSRSSFRKFYKWAIMPTVDSFPQQEQYINSYIDADAVFTYSEFGKDVLEKESHGRIKILGIPSPGANFENLKPVNNKKQHRESYGFMDDVNIIGTIMRNQRRKLYPNLIAAFRTMLDQNPGLHKNTFLYLHTSYPDLGWELPYFIKKYNMGNHTLMTYKCTSCGHFFPSFYQGEKTTCSKCNMNTAQMPSASFGVTGKELGAIINWFDLYVQYSVCEGFGMPQVEAAACGVPVLTINYSAMQSVGEKIKADFIEPKAFFWDSPTHSKRAIPDDDELIEKIAKFIKLPASVKSKRGMDCYIGVKKNYTWDGAAAIWEDYLDEIDIMPYEDTWGSEPKVHQPANSIPDGINNEEFINWAVTHIWGRPDQVNSYVAMKMLKDLNCGKTLNSGESIYYTEDSYMNSQQNYTPFGMNDAANKLINMCEHSNGLEQKRGEVISNGWKNIGKPAFLSAVKADVQTLAHVE